MTEKQMDTSPDDVEKRSFQRKTIFLRGEQVLAMSDAMEDEELWKRQFAQKRDVIRRLASEALEEDARGETKPLDELL
jgi:hypothetical protein